MLFKHPILLIAALTVTSYTNAVLPAIATDNTLMDTSVPVPLIPQIVPSQSHTQVRPITVQPITQQSQPVDRNLGISNNTTQNSSQNQIQTKLTASVIAISPQGGEMLAPITPKMQLPKGSIIEYHGYIINNSPERIKTLKATFDIPTGTELQSIEAITPQPVYGSNDGQQFNYLPIKTNVNGLLQQVPNSYYKSLQWDIAGLGLNEVAEVKYRVLVK